MKKQNKPAALPKYIIGNWKSNPVALKDINKLQKGYQSISPSKNNTRVIVCPSPIHQLLDFPKHIHVGAQSVSTKTGTGMWNTNMLVGSGVSYCIVGHSEQRSIGETDIDVHNKVTVLIESGIVPIVCIGESMRDDKGKYINILKHQLKIAFSELTMPQMGRVIIAYEPVWAIGAGAMRPCTPAECYEVVHIIREEIARMIPGVLAEQVVVLYGGSVDATNAKSYLVEGAANGLLIGRASLDVIQMKAIIKLADTL